MCRKGVSVVAPPSVHKEKGKNVKWATWSHLGVLVCSISVAEGTRRTQMGQFVNDFLVRFL